MADSSEKIRLAVLGSGPGGYAAAFAAADRGMDVTLIGREAEPGGVCLFRGCIPSKALLHVSKVMHEAKSANDWGIRYAEPEVDLDKLRDWKDGVVRKLTGGLGVLAKQRKVKFIQGHGRFKDSHTLEVEKVDGGTETVEVDSTILATGSVPVHLPRIFDFESERVMDSTDALRVETIPESLLVVGGGYIGLELGTVYSSLGSKVTVVEATKELLPGVDRDLVGPLQESIAERFENILLDTRVVEAELGDSGVLCKLVGLGIDEPWHTFDRVLVAVGRRPNVSDVGLDNTGIEIDGTGFVKVDRQRRTTDSAIWCIGDAAGQPMLAHKASYEAKIAVEAIDEEPAAYDPLAIPAVVFTDPEIAWCGLTETEAKRDQRPIKITRFPWGASGRATTLGRNDGLTKLILDPHSERVLGVGIVGYGAGELIAEGVLAVEMGARAEDVEMTIHPHPTLSETVMESAELFFGQSSHYMQRERPQQQ